MSWAAPLVLAAALAGRSPDDRQAMIDLAYLLGAAHALRQACSGPADQAWRERMNRMIELERPDDSLNRRMVDAFNAGFMTRRAEHPSCDAGVMAAERETAARGQALSKRLSGPEP